MAFQSGVSTSPSNLLSAINTFATANGWNINTSTGVGGDPAGSQLSIDDSGAFFNFIPENGNNRILMQLSTAFINASTQYYAHTGNPGGGSSDPGQGINMNEIPGAHVGYAMFGNTSAPRYIHVALEITAGVYSHMSFGTMTKFGAFTGGAFASSLVWNIAGNTNINLPFQLRPTSSVGTHWVRCDNLISYGSPGWMEQAGTYTTGNTSAGIVRGLYQGGLNEINQRSPLQPIYVMAQNPPNQNPGASVPNLPLGEIPDARFISMDGRQAGEVLTIGSDDWYVYPMRSKGTETGSNAYIITGTAPNNTTNLMGIAYRRT